MKKETIILSLGGSLIVPDGINIQFIKDFRKLILSHIKSKRFCIVCGGGKTARNYQNAAKNISPTTKEELDWIGIAATRVNAHLVRAIFGKKAHKEVINDPTKKVKAKENIIIAAGWKPGWSTDYDAVLLAKQFDAKYILNLSNQQYVYNKDPAKFKDAKPIRALSWKEYKKLIGMKWKPGRSVPFDPMATAAAEKLGLKVIVMSGDIKNISNFLSGKKFIGTIIE